jgi:hypothetical protein
VYYTFDGSLSPAKQKAFLDGAAEWALFANLHFIARSAEVNYVTIGETNHLGTNVLEGGVSDIGMDGGQQFIWFSTNAWARHIICHEIGHTLGLVHEQLRSDRDFYITIITNNMIPGYPGLIELDNTLNESPFDFLSVMMYAQYSGSLNPPSLPTMVPQARFSRFANIFGQGDPVLTPYDRAGMALAYGPGPAITNIVTNTQDNGPGSLRAALYFAYDHPGTSVSFNIQTNDPGLINGFFQIQPTDVLPSLYNATTLDGATEPANRNPNRTSIVLNGAQTLVLGPLGNTGVPIRIRGTNCLVQGLAIIGFPNSAIEIDGTNALSNVVSGCYLGVDPSGISAGSNGEYGVIIHGGAQSNLVGGYTPADGNLISGNGGSGIYLGDPGTCGNMIVGNILGLDATGTIAAPNAYYGVEIANGASSNAVGGAPRSARNIISGNGAGGVAAYGTNTAGNIVLGNFVGVDVSGVEAIGNKGEGVSITRGSSFNTIGGGQPGAGNIVSGNGGSGIFLGDSGTTGNVIAGNFLGVDASGSFAVPNAYYGVEIANGPNSNTVGGLLASWRNIISGNGANGVAAYGTNTVGNILLGNFVGVGVSGTEAIGNKGEGVSITMGSSSNVIGGARAGAGNVVSGNGGSGIFLGDSGTAGNVIAGNFLGVDASGTVALPNVYYGVELANGPGSNTVGGLPPAAPNIISGNGAGGMAVYGINTLGNVLLGNFVGVGVSGTDVIGNIGEGISITRGSSLNVIGGGQTGAGNIIGGNRGSGVFLGDSGTIGNVIAGNFLGVGASGAVAAPNAFYGVEIANGPSSNTVGGLRLSLRNVISGNGGSGVAIYGPNTVGNIVLGNYVGVDASGTVSVPNIANGVEISDGAAYNVVGSPRGGRNVISGNEQSGIAIHDTGTSANVVQGNTIGFDAAGGIPVPNKGAGVELLSGAVSNLIGGISPGAANFIAGNMAGGVLIHHAVTTDNTARGNSIFDNAGLGLIVYDSANAGINPPTLLSAALSTNLLVSGILVGLPNSVFHLDFYANPPPSGDTEGMTYLGSIDSRTGLNGTAPFTANLGARIPAGRVITATTTDLPGNTSSLSGGTIVTMVSSVHDSVPDAWRAAFFGGNGATTNSQSCATCDPTNDGMSNLQKFLAGLNPTNSASVLTLVSMPPNRSDVVAGFLSVPGVVYRVESSDDLAADSWSLLEDQIVGTGTNIFFTDPGVFETRSRSYRLQVLW